MQLNETISAVVTGGASGLGEATVRALAAAGVKVAIFDIAEEKGQALAGELGARFCLTDVTSQQSVEDAFEKARSAHGQERILVNCAGRGNIFKTARRERESGAILAFPIEEFERVIQLNLIGTFRCITLAAAGMLAADPLEDGERGVIVNTASVAAIDGQAGQAAYAAGKGGIVSMTLPIARDLMGEGVRVNTILPGLFGTPPMLGLPENFRQALAVQVPFPKRLGYPEEFADLALTMIRNRYFNGEHVRLDGAIRMSAK